MMADFEIVEEKYIALPEVKEILDKVSDKNIEQKRALKNAKRFAKLKIEDSKKLIEELNALDMRKLKDNFIYQIVNVMPKDVDDLKVILASSKIAFKEKEMKSILEVIAKYLWGVSSYET